MDRYGKVLPGSPPILSAGRQNAMVDAARWVRAKANRQRSDSADEFFSGTECLVQNNTFDQRTLPWFSAVQIADVPPLLASGSTMGPLIPPTSGNTIGTLTALEEFHRRIMFKGDVPGQYDTSSLSTGAPMPTLALFAITLEPLAYGAIGKAALAGDVVCQVDVKNRSDGFAAPGKKKTDRLVSAGSGPAQILWHEPTIGIVDNEGNPVLDSHGVQVTSQTGLMWAVVRIGGGSGGGGCGNSNDTTVQFVKSIACNAGVLTVTYGTITVSNGCVKIT